MGPIDRVREVLDALEGMADAGRLEGMRRYGIDTSRALGVTVTELRRLARTLGRDHELAAGLWASGVHEARILATIVDEPAEVTEAQAEAWVLDVRSWDLGDQLTGNLLDRTPFAFAKAVEWSAREETFVRRAGFAMMASLAVHRKEADDAAFEPFLRAIRERCSDDRHLVRKAVSWALRQIGKRNAALHERAVATAREIDRIDDRAARWVARDALRELEGPAVRARLGTRAGGERG